MNQLDNRLFILITFFLASHYLRSVLVLTTCHHNNLQPFDVQLLCNPSLFHIILDANLVLCILNLSWWNWLVGKQATNFKRGEQSCLYYVEQIVTTDLFCLSCKPTSCCWLVVPVAYWPCQLFVCISIYLLYFVNGQGQRTKEIENKII